MAKQTLKDFLESGLKVKATDMDYDKELQKAAEFHKNGMSEFAYLQALSVALASVNRESVIEDFKLKQAREDITERKFLDLCRQFYTSQGYKENSDREIANISFKNSDGEIRDIIATPYSGGFLVTVHRFKF